MKQGNPKSHQKKQGFAKKVGDALERTGEKVQKAGMPKTGRAIYNAGDKIEHLGDKDKR